MKASKSVRTLGSLVLTLTGLAVSCGPAQLNSQSKESEVNNVISQSSEVAFPSGEAVDESLGLTIAGAHCRIEVPVCANGKVAKGVHTETGATVYGDYRPLFLLGATNQGEACRSRANQYARYCENAAGQVIQAKYMDKGAVKLQKASDNTAVALVTIIGKCAPIGPTAYTIDAIDNWGEGFNDSDVNLAAAQQRYLDHVNWCKASPATTHIIYKVVQKGKVAFQRSNR